MGPYSRGAVMPEPGCTGSLGTFKFGTGGRTSKQATLSAVAAQPLCIPALRGSGGTKLFPYKLCKLWCTYNKRKWNKL